MRKKESLFLGVGVLLLLLCSLLFLLGLTTPFVVQGVEGVVVVDDYVGIKLDDDKLYFGTVPEGNGAKRGLVISSDEDSFVIIKAVGESASWISPSDNFFLLDAGERKNVMFTLQVPDATPDGNYSIPIEVRLYRPAARAVLRP